MDAGVTGGEPAPRTAAEPRIFAMGRASGHAIFGMPAPPERFDRRFPLLESSWKAIPPRKSVPPDALRPAPGPANGLGRDIFTFWQAQQILAGRSLGFRIDKYVLLDRIGHGGMGRVYLAKDNPSEPQGGASKVLSPERMNNPRALVRFFARGQGRRSASARKPGCASTTRGECNGVPATSSWNTSRVRNAGPDHHQSTAPWHLPLPQSWCGRWRSGSSTAHQKGLIHRGRQSLEYPGHSRRQTRRLTDLGLAIDLADSEDGRYPRRGRATVGTFRLHLARASSPLAPRSILAAISTHSVARSFICSPVVCRFLCPAFQRSCTAHQLTEG